MEELRGLDSTFQKAFLTSRLRSYNRKQTLELVTEKLGRAMTTNETWGGK